jgi:hypothetical protein
VTDPSVSFFLPSDLTHDQEILGVSAGVGVLLRTITTAMFTDTVKTMRPKVVYPYDYGNNDPKMLAELLKDQQGIDVRVRDMR